MDVYVDRSDFQYVDMDTGRAYMAILGSVLEEVMNPEMQERYQLGLTGIFKFFYA